MKPLLDNIDKESLTFFSLNIPGSFLKINLELTPTNGERSSMTDS